MKTKIEKGFYPISYTDLLKRIRWCENWGYGNKDTCNFVVEDIIEQLEVNYPTLEIKDSLYSELKSLVHNLNKGRKYKGQLLINLI